MNENHIIPFEYSNGIYTRLDIIDDINIQQYKSSKKIQNLIYIDIYYNNLSINGSFFQIMIMILITYLTYLICYTKFIILIIIENIIIKN